MSSDQPTFISASNETLDLQAGKNILSCNATGNPLPSYHWQFPQAAQETYKDQDVNYPILTGPFEFPGVYTCTASNSQGTVTKYFTVNKPPGKFSSVNSVHFPSCYILSSMIFFKFFFRYWSRGHCCNCNCCNCFCYYLYFGSDSSQMQKIRECIFKAKRFALCHV